MGSLKWLFRFHNKSLLLCLSLLTLVFVLSEISLATWRSQFYLADFRLVAHHLGLPWRVLPGIVWFVSAQLLVHAFFLFCIYGITVATARLLHLTPRATTVLGIVLWFDLLLLVLFVNAGLFPNSWFAWPVKRTGLHGLVSVLTGMGMVVLPLLAVFATVWRLISRKNGRVAVLCLALVAGGIPLLTGSDRRAPGGAATAERPNIILIGVDSLRPDFVGFFGSDVRTRHFDHFLEQAAVFPEALTPLARTYPAWVSILTGNPPVSTGIRTNLLDPLSQDFTRTLPAMLQRRGYQTLFATDESRFSNIDRQYGFDRIITPPQGFNDFLLGSANDFPLSNLLANTGLGRWLFPWSYGNRAVHVLYQPDTFLHFLAPALRDTHRPLFLAVHFCLPHFPYVWSSLAKRGRVTLNHYRLAVARVDLQFDHFMKMLRKNHLLDHAIVVLLSDHGEGVEMAGDRITDPDLFVARQPKTPFPHFYPPSVTHETVEMSGGHGTDVLGLPQYHSLLAFRTFGDVLPARQGMIPGMVSLLDIHPTLLDWLGIPARMGERGGVSLFDTIRGKVQSPPTRDFFVESDFSPSAIRSVHPEMRRALFEGIHFFRIDPVTTQVRVRENMLKLILSSKQYAVYSGQWVLALYPQKNQRMQPVLVNLFSGQWTTDFKTSFALHSPAPVLFRRMEKFFHQSFSVSVDSGLQ